VSANGANPQVAFFGEKDAIPWDFGRILGPGYLLTVRFKHWIVKMEHDASLEANWQHCFIPHWNLSHWSFGVARFLGQTHLAIDQEFGSLQRSMLCLDQNGIPGFLWKKTTS